MPPNSRSPKPYNVRLDEETGYYFFRTNQDILYVCGFQNITSALTPLVGIYDIEIGEFSFFREPSKEYEGRDERVSDTVVDLLKNYLQDENRVLIYLCDASDGRPQARQTLFSRWHRTSMDMIDHKPVKILVQGAVVCGGILTRKDFPYRNMMSEQLHSRAVRLIAEKIGR